MFYTNTPVWCCGGPELSTHVYGITWFSAHIPLVANASEQPEPSVFLLYLVP